MIERKKLIKEIISRHDICLWATSSHSALRVLSSSMWFVVIGLWMSSESPIKVRLKNIEGQQSHLIIAVYGTID